jgi:hypothetical protein
MVLRIAIGKLVQYVVSVFAPHIGRAIKEKEEFYILLGKVLKNVGEKEQFTVCGDMNGHVVTGADRLEGVHGGKGFGARNADG